MWHRRLLLLPLFVLACDSPVAPLACNDALLDIYAIREHSLEYEICFDYSGREALTYTAKSSDTDVVTADVSGDMLIVTGQTVGEARVTVTARANSGAIGTVDYQIVARNALDGEITKCVMTPAADEGTDYDLEYWLRANVDLVSVAVRLTLGGIDGGARPTGDMSAGQRIEIFGNGWMRDTATSDECRLALDYVIAD